MARSKLRIRLDEERDRRRRRFRRMMVAILGFAVISLSTFSGSAVCSYCGRHRDFTHFQIPFTALTYWTHDTIEETPLSATASALLPDSHSHNWVLVHGHSFGTIGGIGPGRFFEPNTRSDLIVAFIGSTQKHLGDDAARHYLGYALDPENGRLLKSWLDTLSFPTSPDIDRESFELWMNRASNLISGWELLAAYQPESAS